MEIKERTWVRLKSDPERIQRFVTNIRDGGAVHCAWIEPGEDKWRGNLFNARELEEVPPGEPVPSDRWPM